MNAVRTYERLSELDELIEAWPGSPIHPVQVSSGALDLELDGAVARDLAVLRFSLAPRLIDHVRIAEDRTGFVLIERPMISMGVEITPPALLVNHSGREYRSVLEPGFRSIEIMVGHAKLHASRLGQLLADVRSCPEQTILPLSDTLAAELRRTAAEYIATAEIAGSGEVRASLQAAAEARVFGLLARLLQGHRSAALEPASVSARTSIALAALTELERDDVELDLQEVSEQLGVSRRAVEKSFRALLGISPAQYLLACRLNDFRRSLLGSAERVSDGMTDAGLVDASRAARQYQRLFGELPSITLRRAHARVAGS